MAKKLLKFIRSKGNYICNFRTVKVFHYNICEIAVHFWHNASTTSGNLPRLDYTRGIYGPSCLPGCTDTMDNIPHVSSIYHLYRPRRGQQQGLHDSPGTEICCFLQTSVKMFTDPIYTILDQFKGSYSTCRA